VQDFKGKTVVITGAAHRLGRAMALAFAASGASVAITYRTSSREAAQTIRALKAHNVKTLSVHCDLRDPRSVKQAAAKIKKHFRSIDILINNASVYQTVEFDKITPSQWEDVLLTNVRGPYLMSQALLPQLRHSQGRIINIGSLGGLRPWTTHAHYCSSKAALHMLTQTMAKAWAPDISVNCVAPGMVDLPSEMKSEIRKRLAAKTPMHRNASASDVISAALYFATCPQFITGQILTVDGGLSLI